MLPCRLVLLVLAGVCLANGPIRAAPLAMKDSRLSLQVATLPEFGFAGPSAPLRISVSSGSGGFVLPAGLLAGSGFLPPQLFTGISLIETLSVNAINGTLTVNGALGTATGGVFGSFKLGILGGLVNLQVPISLGVPGTTSDSAAGAMVTVENLDIWTTGVVSVTGLSLPTPGGAVVNTVTLTGSDARSPGHQGTLTLVTPVRVTTGFAGVLPVFGSLSLRFVSEPGGLALAAGLVLLFLLEGRRRLD